MKDASMGIKQRMLAGVIMLLLGLGTMLFGLSSAPASSAEAAKPATCNQKGYTKGPDEDASSGDEDYPFGSLTWSGNSLSYDIKAGYTVQICLKAGSWKSVPSGPFTEKTVTGPATGSLPTSSGKGISHIGYKFSTSTPSTTPTTASSTPTTASSTPTTASSTPTTASSTPTSPSTIDTLPTESTAPTDPTTTPIETMPTESSRPNDPGKPNNPGDPGDPGDADEDPEVLGIAKKAPVAAPTAVDAGMTEGESSSSTMWILLGAALAVVGVALGFVPATSKGKRTL